MSLTLFILIDLYIFLYILVEDTSLVLYYCFFRLTLLKCLTLVILIDLYMLLYIPVEDTSLVLFYYLLGIFWYSFWCNASYARYYIRFMSIHSSLYVLLFFVGDTDSILFYYHFYVYFDIHGDVIFLTLVIQSSLFMLFLFWSGIRNYTCFMIYFDLMSFAFVYLLVLQWYTLL